MRTKTLVLSALLGLAAVGTQAQVYSTNVVGYVTVTLTNGFNLVANPLDMDGTGTNNTFAILGTNWPTSTRLWAWSPSTQGYKSALWIGGKWNTTNSDLLAGVQPGGGFFIQIPGSTPTNINLTLVGNVIQGTNFVNVKPGYNMVTTKYPISDTVTNLGYTPSPNDKVYLWNQSGQGWSTRLKIGSGASWSSGGCPTIGVAQGMFIQTTNTVNWQQILNIPQQ